MKKIELKKLMGYCLIITMIFTMLPINIVNAGVPTSGNWKDHIGGVTLAGKGLGTENSPFQISSAEELAYLAKEINEGNTDYNAAYYELTADIDLVAHQWTPIGSYEGASNIQTTFYGHFDGKGHKITNVIIGTSTDPYTMQYAGLFGYSSNGSTIENIGVSVNIVSSKILAGVGGLVGYCSHGTIKNSYVTGSVTAQANYSNAGGLVGNNSGTISNSYSTASVIVADGATGNYATAGGLVGSNFMTGIISNSYATGNITGGNNAYVGLFLGKFSTGGTIDNCYYNSGATRTINNRVKNAQGIGFGVPPLSTEPTISKTLEQMKEQEFANALSDSLQTDWSTWMVQPDDFPTLTFIIPAPTLTVTISPGTDIGSTQAKITGTETSKFVVNITDSLVSAPPTSEDASTSGDNLVDPYTSESNITTGVAENKYLQVYDVDANGKVAGFYQKQLVASDIKQPSYWKDNIGSVSSLTGSGTEAKPYQISSAEELAFMAQEVNAGNATYKGAYYELTQDIDLVAHQWTPIGIYGGDFNKTFSGHFDGKKHNISNIYIGTESSPDTEHRYLGLFGYSVGTIDNIGVDVHIVSSENMANLGGLVGSCAFSGATIKNSYVTGSIEAKGNFSVAGGLAGFNLGEINNSCSTASVIVSTGAMGNEAKAGGLVGDNSGVINNSYATGDITGGHDSKVGGLVGLNSSTIANGYYNTNA
ncbi:GLUG motif-containing protein, partial [Marinisporobacter balticus]